MSTPTTFFAELQDDLDWSYFDDFGEPVQYQPIAQKGSGNFTTITAVVHVLATDVVQGGDGARLDRTGRLFVKASDGAPFNFGDIFICRGSGWTGAIPEQRPDGSLVIDIKSSERYEASKSDARR